MMTWVDIPPVWLVGFVVLAWLQSAFLPVGITIGAQPFGIVLIVLGFVLMGTAVFQMWRAETTLIPRWDASTIMTTGVFALSRNPIYLGDAFVLAGLVLYWGAWPSLVLVPIFMWLISWRFIEGEEEMLGREFKAEFAAYKKETRRWL